MRRIVIVAIVLAACKAKKADQGSRGAILDVLSTSAAHRRIDVALHVTDGQPDSPEPVTGVLHWELRYGARCEGDTTVTNGAKPTATLALEGCPPGDDAAHAELALTLVTGEVPTLGRATLDATAAFR
jgi:hypothetical protein